MAGGPDEDLRSEGSAAPFFQREPLNSSSFSSGSLPFTPLHPPFLTRVHHQGPGLCRGGAMATTEEDSGKGPPSGPAATPPTSLICHCP